MFSFQSQDEGLVENDLEGEEQEKFLLTQQLFELREQRLVSSSTYSSVILCDCECVTLLLKFPCLGILKFVKPLSRTLHQTNTEKLITTSFS